MTGKAGVPRGHYPCGVNTRLIASLVVVGSGLALLAAGACTQSADPRAGEPARPGVPSDHAPIRGNGSDGYGDVRSAVQVPEWKALEAPLLTEHVQLTSRERFVKAGEAYFDHASPPRWVIFQAVPAPESGKEPEPFYGMYVARLRYDAAGGGISGVDAPVRISPESSANTCGWFDPVRAEHVIFASSLVRPSNQQRPGFQVGTRNYIWMFPSEMEVVSRTVPEVFRSAHPGSPEPRWTGDALEAKPVFRRPNYDAECSFSKDGRLILYSHVRDEPTRGRDDADIWVYNTQTGEERELVHGEGYDGGPFFSPDGKRICYRSDRAGDNLLQLFVADLEFDSRGMPTGVSREYQVTSNGHVNWAPYWHPSGKFLLYGTSEMGHANYEVFAVEAPEVGEANGRELRHRRVTSASGADVLPVFSDDGRWMMWTGQRGPMVEGESKPSSQVWVARFNPLAAQEIVPFPSFPVGEVNETGARERMIELLRAEEATRNAHVRAAGHTGRAYDLRQLEVVRIAQGWRGHVNPWNMPDGGESVFVLRDGRVFSAAEYGGPPKGELAELMYAPAVPPRP